jgi:hypothetical protein
MESLDNQNIEGKKGNKNLTGFLAGAVCAGIALVGIAAVDLVNYNKQIKKELHQFVSVLDTNKKDGKLDAKEIKKFYDVTKLNPYTVPFDSITRDQWNSFLKNYKGK